MNMNKKYDYLIVGAGLYGSVLAYELNKLGYRILVVDKRNHIGGNIYTKKSHGINVHEYGAHIFHTSDKKIWEYVNRFAKFNNFINSPLANYKGKLFHLPFNLNTFEELWGISDPEEVKIKIETQVKKENIKAIHNLEEQALSLVGRDMYETLIKGYTEKQWGKNAAELPSFIIKRIPVRFYRDNNYFDDSYQGIPFGGYTSLIAMMLEGIKVVLNKDYLENKIELDTLANFVIYTGEIDRYFSYCYGPLEYRSLKFVKEHLNLKSFQNNAVVNYTEKEVPYTRIIEHKYFENVDTPTTIITKEYPAIYDKFNEPYYPINNEENNIKYEKYANEAKKWQNVFFGGRLGKYKYFDMDDTIAEALTDLEIILSKKNHD
ncbi:MAG: UDP-galactopyranose mutase [Bacilli bacterium]